MIYLIAGLLALPGFAHAGGTGSATVAPFSVQEGSVVTSSLTFTSPAGGIAQGGQIQILLPTNWGPMLQNVNSTNSGYVSVSPTGQVTLTPSTTAPMVTLVVTTGTLPAGAMLQINFSHIFVACPAPNQTTTGWIVQTAAATIDALAPIAGAPVVNYAPGAARQLTYFPWNQLTVAAGQPSQPIVLQVTDACGKTVPLSSGLNVTLQSEFQNQINFNYVPDPSARLSTTTNFSVAASTLSLTLNSGDTSATYYYETTGTGNNFWIVANYVNPLDSTAQAAWRQVNALATAPTFNAKSVDTGAIVTGQTVLTMTPDGDGVNDSAFIRFTPSSAALNWHVLISTDNNFATSVFERWGSGNPQSTLVWDGHNQFLSGYPVVADGVYTVKLEFPNITTDVSMTITVHTAQMSGRVLLGGNGVAGAQVNALSTNGPGYSSTLADASGNYVLNGLRSGGTYNLYATFASTNSQVPVTGQLSNVSAPAGGQDFNVALPGILRVSASIAPRLAASSVFGNLNAHSLDYSQNYFGNIRLSSGTSQSDNGDYFNPSTWTILYVKPGNYTLHLQMGGYGVSDQSVTAVAGQLTDTVLTLTPQASLFGLIQLPSPVTQPTWVPVQLTPTGSKLATVFGGASFNVGQSIAVYSIFAVPAGNYGITASPSGLIAQTISGFAVGTLAIGNPGSGSGGLIDFSSFSAGESIVGSITIQGDTSQFPSLPLWINAYSPTTNLNGFTQVTASTSATSTSVTYQIGGLAPGVYQLNPPYLAGFSLTPPGGISVVVKSTLNVANLVLAQDAGILSGNLLLPGGAVDYNKVHISLQGSVSSEIDGSGPTYTLPHLGGGYYSITVTYKTSGAQVRRSIQITNGVTQNLDFDLTAPSYNVSGTVGILSGFSIANASGSLVNVNTIPDLLAAATTQSLVIGGQLQGPPNGLTCQGGTAQLVSAARVEAFPKTFNSYNDASRSAFANCYSIGQYKFGVINASGTYHIDKLSAGVWEIDVYPYFDGGQSPNVATVKKIITITNGDLGNVNFDLSNGNSVSGSLNLPSGVNDTRSFNALLLDNQGNLIQQATLQITAASSTTFQFVNLPAGTYALQIQDQGSFDATSGQFVTKYVAKPVQIAIQGVNLTGQAVNVANASRIVGKLAIQQTNPVDGSTSLTLITSANQNLLPSNFSVQAQADPWVQGGSRQANFSMSGPGLAFDSNNQFTIDGLASGSYDVNFQQNSFDAAFQGKGSINIASYSQGPITVPPGQTLDLGTIALLPGISVTGTVRDGAGHPLGNIPVRTQPSNRNNGNGSNQTFTDAQGNFTLAGLSPTFKIYDFTAAPRPDSGSSDQPVPYGQAVLKAVDVTKLSGTGLQFTLRSASAGLTGKVVTADSGALSYPQGNQAGYPAAAIFVRASASPDQDNPLGDDTASDLDGTFTIPYLTAGTYDITIESLGYKPLKLANVVLTTGIKDLGTLTLQKGPTLTVTLAKPDGTAVNTNDVQFAVAATADLGTILFGKINSDANTTNINSIVFAGFDLSPSAYSVLLFDQKSNITAPAEGRNITFTSNSDALVKALTYAPTAPGALTHVIRTGSAMAITFYFTRPIRNRLDDQDPTQWVSVTSGGGGLSGAVLSGDRRQFTVLYDPAPGELNATIRFAAHTVDIDPSTGVEFPLVKSVTLLLGQKATTEGNVTSALGGNLSLSDNDDPSSVHVPANALLTSTGSAVDPTQNFSITFTATDDPTKIPAATLHVSPMQGLMARGAGAYVSEAYRAMTVAKAQSINPLSSFYSILLPAGISHSLNQTAYITLSYDASADPTQLNVYFFDGTQYILQSSQRTVDTVNRTITVGVSHFSTFVVLQNNAPIVSVTGGSAVSTDSRIEVFNFPNPFNLQTKTKTLSHGGSTTLLATDGTIIRYSIPAAFAGPAALVIYDVVGEKVRTIDLGTPATDTENYLAWDGKNDAGHKVASGVYVGELKVGSEKRFWKMAVVK